MKIVLCLLLVSIAIVYGKKNTLNIPPQFIPEMLRITDECSKKSGAGTDAVVKILAGQIENSDKYKNFIFCFGRMSGFANKEGVLNVDKIASLVEGSKDKAKFIDTIKECNKEEGTDKVDKMFKETTCIIAKSPITFTV